MGIQLEASTAGGRRPLDTEINLIPMIDLLIVSISFLLITAVWTQLSRLNVTQQMPGGEPQAATAPPKPAPVLRVTEQGYLLSTASGASVTIERQNGAYDLARLRAQLQETKQADSEARQLTVTPEDGVAYQDIIAAMDVALQSGFADLSIADGASS